jgi:hypothetical protein
MPARFLPHLRRPFHFLPSPPLLTLSASSDRNVAPGGAAMEILALLPFRPIKRIVTATPSTTAVRASPSQYHSTL